MALINPYPNYYYPQTQAQNLPQVPAIPQVSQNNGIIWVQGEAGAKSYLVAPNNTVQLWDSEAQVIYLKSADASGMPSIKTLDYTIREVDGGKLNVSGASDYATKDDISDLQSQLEDVKRELKSFSHPSNAKSKRREVTKDE